MLRFPLFTVVIPLYNKELHVQRALESVQQQTVPKWRAIVVDDGSTDGSAAIAEDFSSKDERITLIRQANSGVSAARNAGIRHSSTEIVAFLDADDQWKPHLLSTILRLVTLYPQAGFYATGYEFCEPSGKRHAPVLVGLPPHPWEGLVPNYLQIARPGGMPVCTSAVAVRRDALLAVGGFTEAVKIGEDAEVWAKLAMLYPLALSRSIQAVYHRDATNRHIDMQLPLAKHYWDSLPDFAIAQRLDRTVLAQLHQYLDRSKLHLADQHIRRGNRKHARRILRTTVCLHALPEQLRLWSLSFFPPTVVRLIRRLKSLM